MVQGRRDRLETPEQLEQLELRVRADVMGLLVTPVPKEQPVRGERQVVARDHRDRLDHRGRRDMTDSKATPALQVKH